MRSAILTRLQTGDEGTFGLLKTDDGAVFATGELPWRDNQSGRSCVIAKKRVARRRESPKHGMCYHLDDTDGRTDVEIHAGNLCGDVDKGYGADVLGCLLPGKDVALFKADSIHPGKPPRDQRGVTSSGQALAELNEHFNGEDFELDIQWAPGVLERAS